MDAFLTGIESLAGRYLTHRKRVKAYNKSRPKTILWEIWSWVDALIFAVFWVIIINQFLFQFFLIPTPSMVSTLNVNDRVAVIKNAYGTELYPGGRKISTSSRKVERDDIITFYNPEYESKGPVFDLLSQVVFMGTLSLVNIDRNPDGSIAERLYVKRAVGMSGDTVRFEHGNVYIKPAGEQSFIPEEDFRAENGLSTGPHRSVDMSLYPGLDAYADLLAYQQYGIMAQAPAEIISRYESLDKSTNVFDMYAVEKEKARMSSLIDPADMSARSLYNAAENGIFVPEGSILPLGDNRDNSRDGRYFGPVGENKINGKVVFRFWPLDNISVLSGK